MLIKKEFGQRAEHDGIFRASIHIPKDERHQLWDALYRVCNEKGVVCGYNENDDGYEFGFESQADHDAVMNALETKINELWDGHVKQEQHFDRAIQRYAKRFGTTPKESAAPLPSPDEEF